MKHLITRGCMSMAEWLYCVGCGFELFESHWWDHVCCHFSINFFSPPRRAVLGHVNGYTKIIFQQPDCMPLRELKKTLE